MTTEEFKNYAESELPDNNQKKIKAINVRNVVNKLFENKSDLSSLEELMNESNATTKNIYAMLTDSKQVYQVSAMFANAYAMLYTNRYEVENVRTGVKFFQPFNTVFQTFNVKEKDVFKVKIYKAIKEVYKVDEIQLDHAEGNTYSITTSPSVCTVSATGLVKMIDLTYNGYVQITVENSNREQRQYSDGYNVRGGKFQTAEPDGELDAEGYFTVPDTMPATYNPYRPTLYLESPDRIASLDVIETTVKGILDKMNDTSSGGVANTIPFSKDIYFPQELLEDYHRAKLLSYEATVMQGSVALRFRYQPDATRVYQQGEVIRIPYCGFPIDCSGLELEPDFSSGGRAQLQGVIQIKQ